MFLLSQIDQGLLSLFIDFRKLLLKPGLYLSERPRFKIFVCASTRLDQIQQNGNLFLRVAQKRH